MTTFVAAVWVLVGVLVLVAIWPLFANIAVGRLLFCGTLVLCAGCAGLGLVLLFAGEPSARLLGTIFTTAGVVGLSIHSAALWLREALAKGAVGATPPVTSRDEHAAM